MRAGLIASGMLMLAGAGQAAAQTVRAPEIGAFAIDPADHDPAPTAPEPLPSETSTALDAMIADEIGLAGSAPTHGAVGRFENGGVGRLARRIGGDEIVVPVLTLHLGKK